MTKQEQIEEMVKTVVDREKNYVIGETECKKCNLNKCDLHCNIHSEISYDCETLYNAGYRKDEEVRKETAKEIFTEERNLVKEFAEKLKIEAIRLPAIENYHVCNLIDKLLKEYEK